MTNLVRVFYATDEVFSSLSEQPRWRMPVVASLLMAFLFTVMVLNSIDLQVMTRKQLESYPQLAEKLGKERIDEMVKRSDSTAQKIITGVTATLTDGFLILLVSGLLTGLFWLMNGITSFRKVLSVTAYVFYLYYLVVTVLTAVVIISTPDKSTIQMDGLVKSSLGSLLNGTGVSKPLLNLLYSLDVLSLGSLLLLAFGLSRVGLRLSFRKATLALAGLWCLWVVVKVGFSALL